MRIAFLNTHPVWTSGLPWGFRSLGHEVAIPRSFERNYFEAFVEAYAPEIFISVGWTQDYTGANIQVIKDTIKNYGGVHIYWAVEDYLHLDRWSLPLVKEMSPHFVFTINDSCIKAYEELGIPAAHLEFACNPDFHRKEATVESYCHDIALVANTYNLTEGYRWECVNHLVKPLLEKYDLAIWGKGWDTFPSEAGFQVPAHLLQGAAPYSETPKIYSSAKIVLGLQNENRFQTQVTLRTFEIIGSGAFLLTSGTPAVKALFSDRIHLAMSDNPNLTCELTDFYLHDSNARDQVSQTGQRLVYQKHTYKQRAEQILKTAASQIEKNPPRSPCKALGIHVNALQSVQLQPPVVAKTLRFDEDSNADTVGEIIQVGYQEKNQKFPSIAYLCFDASLLSKSISIYSAQLYLWSIKLDGIPVCKLATQPHPINFEQTSPPASISGQGTTGWTRWDITGIFREWLNKENASTIALLLFPGKKEDSISFFLGKAWPDHVYRPKLVIIYA